jgi:hypothetical protein
MMENSGMLRPQDVLVACHLALRAKDDWTRQEVAEALRLSPSEIGSNVLRRCRAARLLANDKVGSKIQKPRLLEFLLHGAPVVFLPKRLGIVRGLATGLHAPAFRDRHGGRLAPLVWPCDSGGEQGEGLVPIYHTVPRIAEGNPALWSLLGALDILRTSQDEAVRKVASAYMVKVLGS